MENSPHGSLDPMGLILDTFLFGYKKMLISNYNMHKHLTQAWNYLNILLGL